MPINPIRIASEIETRFRRYLTTTFAFPNAHADLREQFAEGLEEPGRLFRGPYLHGLAPYVRDLPVTELVKRGVLPAAAANLPLLSPIDRPLYRHQVRAIERLRAGRNVVVSSGTGSGKTLSFLAPILASVIEDPRPGVHALLLYPMNALVNDQLKNLRRVLRSVPQIRFGRYINVQVTPHTEREGRRMHPEAPPNEVVSREVFRQNPPHLLITNYAMLEYLLLRVDDTPLFQGPWRFIVVDEAHTYGGTKGGEVALLLRRLVARVKAAGDKPPQYIATSASLGTDNASRRLEVLEFARTLFNAPFEDGDLIAAEQVHSPAPGGTEPDPTVYTHPVVAAACNPGAKWTPELTATLKSAGFSSTIADAAAAVGAKSVEEGLYRAFQEDSRVERLRDAAKFPRDLRAASMLVLGRDDPSAVEQLCGLVRISSLARVPDGDARLVPCRYHLFVRGLNGAYIALGTGTDRATATLFLEPVRETEDGRKAFELRACRKCGQPYLYGTTSSDSGGATLTAAGTTEGHPTWLTWSSPDRRSDDEADEGGDDTPARFPALGLNPQTGRYRDLSGGDLTSEEVRVWHVHAEEELQTCVSCGGRNTVTGVRADAEAAQSVVADAFYRCLPEATCPPARPEALEHPGRGRKMLAFSDNRQSAAYFAPYFENTNQEQLIRRLVYQAAERSAAALGGATDGDTLVGRMLRIAEDDGLFPLDLPRGQRVARCARAVVSEFCLQFGRRQSLEALALIACGVELKRRWTPPPALLEALSPEEADGVAQVLLATVRQLKAVEMPDQVSATDPSFLYQAGVDAMIAQGSERGTAGYRLHGFAPERRVHLQRRAAYLMAVLQRAAARAGAAAPTDSDVLRILEAVWVGLTSAASPGLTRVTVAPGQVGHQIRWTALWLRPGGPWYFCPNCQQWSAYNVLGVCPSFRCTGTLDPADPAVRLAGHHYRRTFSLPDQAPVPLVAREHTAQLGPHLATVYQLAFQDGHAPEAPSDCRQINVLSSSTTFELGVDLGDLEAVFLRNVPPSPANYQQRAGRAGRGVGSAAFAVTFAMPRSHDEHYFANPPQMIDGVVRPPRADLRNETIYLRHLNAVLLAEFVRDWAVAHGQKLSSIGEMIPEAPTAAPLEQFLTDLPAALGRNTAAVEVLVPGGTGAVSLPALVSQVTEAFREACRHYADEVEMYARAIDENARAREEAERANELDRARRLSNFGYFLRQRLEDFRGEDWVTYLSDRSVLPSYAFPIYNVPLVTSDKELKLDRDLRLALSEYVPGAAVVAKGKLWRSVGIRKPWQRPLEEKWYARCPSCGHVMRHLSQDEVFPTGTCPVCQDDGMNPPRRKYRYVVPSFGFTTDLTEPGEELAFDRPQRIPASRVLFVPQQRQEDPVRNYVGDGTHRVEVRSTERAEFFVFNPGEEADGMGFRLCRTCGRAVDEVTTGKGKNKKREIKAHCTPYGSPCQSKSAERVHMGHEFISSAARLVFSGTGHPYTDQSFWPSLMYAVLGGMTDALCIDPADINGVIRPVSAGSAVAQEVVIFDDVPGGAGHALRLEGRDELIRVIEAAHARVANCPNGCGEDTSCYACLRSYRNQFCHEALARGPVAEYLVRLLDQFASDPEDDRPYTLPDRAGAIRAAVRSATNLDIVAERLDATGPPEIGPWHLHLLEAASRPGTRVRLAFLGPDNVPTEGTGAAHLVTLAQAGVGLFRVRLGAPATGYGLLALGPGGQPGHRSAGFHWGEPRATAFDAETQLRPLWFNRTTTRLARAGGEADAWFAAHTEPIPPESLFRTLPGCTVHPFAKGQPVNFGPVFAGLTGHRIVRCQLQDPYLLTAHQMEALTAFVKAVPWGSSGPIAVRLTTHMTENDPTKRFQLSPDEQRRQLESRLGAIPGAKPEIKFRSSKYDPLHMRYAYFQLEGGERLYVLERGLDVADPRGGKARDDSYILEFATVPDTLADVLKLAATKPPGY
jgi:hypothetical protein